jgi:hypothetical protein
VTVLYEPLKLRIDDTCWYCPDFYDPRDDNLLRGQGRHAWEDSIVKFKAARAIHTWAKFEMHQKKLGVWRQIRNLPYGS